MMNGFSTFERRVWRVSALVASVIGAAVLSGCAGTPKAQEAPLAAMGDPTAHTASQVASVRRVWEVVESGEMDHAAGRESLKRIAWARLRWAGVRQAAIETLLLDEANIADTRNMMRLMLPTETHWEIISFICTTAADKGWKDLTGSIVRSWSRPVVAPPDDRRPERLALERLHPEVSVEEVVFGVFSGVTDSGEEMRERDRRDAWTLLQRIDANGSRTIAMLKSTDGPNDDIWVSSLRKAARELHCVPTTGEQLQWVSQLGRPEHSAFWTSAASAIAALTDDQREGLELRHAAAILWASEHRPHWLDMSRDTLLNIAQTEQKSQRKHLREVDRSGGVAAVELVPAWREKLSWGDAIAILIGFELAEAPGVAATLFEQAAVDMRDTSTEQGGVIDSAHDGFALRGFVPRPSQRMGDRQFIAPVEMIEGSPVSIFHYHFHVQRIRNSDYAGPSGEDIEYAKRFGRTCVVFTSIDADTLNADYFQGSGAVIDLGEIKRPSPSR